MKVIKNHFLFATFYSWACEKTSTENLITKNYDWVVPWWASNRDTWTGYKITYFMLNLFIPSPLCALLPVPEKCPLPLTLVISFEPSTSNSWVGQCHAAVTRVHILGYYRFKTWKYGECNKYVRLFRSEQEFGVSRDICEQIVYVVYAPVWFIK